MKKIVECVPNISEGRDLKKINEIANVVKSVSDVRLLNIDPGKATNRTVITFVGTPEGVLESAFLLIQKAQELIDMRKHNGEHPRMGATDVCPIIPISNVSMEEAVDLAHKLSKKIGKELAIPVYCYENAAKEDKRKNLANCREGEYEGLNDKLNNPEWKPDYGPAEFNNEVAKSGATAISARDFLIAYNINLNTTSTRRANAIAFDIREAGRIKRKDGKITGEIIKDSNGEPERVPGIFKHVKGIGWYIEEYGISQISYNLTNIDISPLHEVFEKTCEKALERGVRVTGSEIIGLIPKKVLLNAGIYFLKKQKRSIGISEKSIIDIAIKTLGLNELSPFNPEERIIEYLIDSKRDVRPLINLSLTEFAYETSSESPAPGGGSISAYCGALGAALATMVANLSAHKRGWDEKWEEFSDWAEKGLFYQDRLLNLVDKDTVAFNKIIQAFRMPKDANGEKRYNAIQDATKFAIETPFEIMKMSYDSMNVIKAMAENGNPNSITDAGVGALCARTAVIGAYLNVKINCKDLDDKEFVNKTLKEAEDIVQKAKRMEKEILDMTILKL